MHPRLRLAAARRAVTPTDGAVAQDELGRETLHEGGGSRSKLHFYTYMSLDGVIEPEKWTSPFLSEELANDRLTTRGGSGHGSRTHHL